MSEILDPEGILIDAEDILTDAQNCIECIFMAAGALGDETDPIQTVANIAIRKIDAAIALLRENSTDMGDGPEPAAPSVKPVSRTARAKRKGK
jgi:hypothetical protein